MKTGTLINGDGYVIAHGVEVVDHGDTISIGSAEHLKSDLAIRANEIESKAACPPWKVILK